MGRKRRDDFRGILNKKESLNCQEFTAGFAGNPQPEVAWFYNGNKLEESDRVKITTNTTTSTLHMDGCTMEMDGVYECRIDNKLGSDKTKASLIISPQSD